VEAELKVAVNQSRNAVYAVARLTLRNINSIWAFAGEISYREALPRSSWLESLPKRVRSANIFSRKLMRRVAAP
jgi:hypothetical protein